MRPHQVPSWVQRIFPKRTWEGPDEPRQVFLTFDDGPVPGITDFVLTELAKRDQKATFFVVGDNVNKHPALAKEVLSEGHQLGNHTYHHLHGFKTSTDSYVKNVVLCDQILGQKLGLMTPLFRPPYGLLTPRQAKILSKQKQLVMWSVLTGDYDRSIAPNTLLKAVKPMTSPGKIIVFHDQEKTDGHLQKILPDYLSFIKDNGFTTGLL